MGSFLAALSFLTVIPIGRRSATGSSAPLSGSSAWAFPFVGLIIGVLLALVDQAASLVFPRTVVAVLVVVVLAAVTGGMNLDGLADSADGLLVAAGPERRLEIMRDSRVGSFGVVAVVLVLMAKVVFLSVLSGEQRMIALILAPVLSRTAVVAVSSIVPPARLDGMGVAMRPARVVAAAVTAAVLVPVAALAPVAGLPAAGVAVVAGGLGRLGWARVGGYTGDILGAIIETSEAAVFLLAGIRWL